MPNTLVNLLAISLPILAIASAVSDDYVVVLDTTSNMKGNRLTAVRQALMSFVLDGTGKMRVGVVGFSKGAKLHSSLVGLTSNYFKQELLSRLPMNENLSSTGNARHRKGIQKALSVFKKSFDSNRKVMIVVTASWSPETIQKFKQVAKKIENQDIVVHFVVIGSKATKNDFILEISRMSKGMVFYESETPGEPYTVTEALLQITKKTTPRAKINLLHMSTFTLSPENSSWTGYVDIDSDLGIDTVFYVSWTSQNGRKVSDVDFYIITPENLSLTGDNDVSNYGYSSAFDMTQFNIKNLAKPGKWTMKVSSSAGRISVTSMVLSRARDPRQAISVEPTVRMIEDFETRQCQYALISARVTKNNRPVLGAKVTATITRANQRPDIIELYDNSGSASSERGKNDGEYANSYVDDGFINNVWYNVRVTVTVRDDGDMPYVPGQPRPDNHDPLPTKTSNQNAKKSLELFKRMEGLGLLAPNCTDQSSIMRPNPIYDLEVVKKMIKCGVVTLTWTAPGGIAHNGRAASYELRMARTHEELRLYFHTALLISPSDVLPESPSRIDKPLPARETETLIFRCSECREKNVPYFFRIEARNDAGIRSKLSNIAYGGISNDCEEPSFGSPTTQPKITTVLTNPSNKNSQYFATEQNFQTEKPMTESTTTEAVTTSSMTQKSSSMRIPNVTSAHAETITTLAPEVRTEAVTSSMTQKSSAIPTTPSFRAETVTTKIRTEQGRIRSSHPETATPITEKAQPWWYQYPQVRKALELDKSAGSFGTVFQPDPCKCDVTTIREPVCSQHLTFLGKVESVEETELGYESAILTEVMIFSPFFPNGVEIDHNANVINQCVDCKSMRANRWYALTANLNPIDEIFYTDGKSMMRRISTNTIAKNRDRIITNLQKCSQEEQL